MDGPENSRDLRDLIQTAQRIQAEVARIKDGLSSKTASGESGGGLVRCVVSGTGEVLELTIDPTFPTFGSLERPENKEMLEDLIVGAVNVALARARDIAKDEISRVTGGLPVPPGMFGA
jgi:DNA-binding YbaB/EbfC family protein